MAYPEGSHHALQDDGTWKLVITPAAIGMSWFAIAVGIFYSEGVLATGGIAGGIRILQWIDKIFE